MTRLYTIREQIPDVPATTIHSLELQSGQLLNALSEVAYKGLVASSEIR